MQSPEDSTSHPGRGEGQVSLAEARKPAADSASLPDRANVCLKPGLKLGSVKDAGPSGFGGRR